MTTRILSRRVPACSRLALSAVLLASTGQTALAQGIGQRAFAIEEITVSAQRRSSTSPSLGEALAALERIPGGIGFVDAEVIEDDFAQSIGDALQFTPGVYADTAAQRETRISIRGSGLSSSFERRGLTALRDGVPITRASGSTEFQEVDPLSVRYFEVYKGANGLRYGSASLGGAVNLVSPTGQTVKAPFSARIEGGSFSTLRGHIETGDTFDRGDYYAGVTGLRSNGFRDHSDVRSLYGFANVGYQLSDTVETRFYLTALSDNFELAGSLSFADAMAEPTAAARPIIIGPFFPGGPVTVLDAGPEDDDWDRNLDVYRIANRTVATLGDITLEGGFWYAYRTLDHAITRFAGIIAQTEDEYGLYGRASGGDIAKAGDFAWTVGFSANVAANDAKRYVNDYGQRGALSAHADQDSSNIVVYGQLEYALSDDLTAVAGVQWTRAVRENEVFLNGVSGRVANDQLSPRLGLIYDLGAHAQVFANVNRGYEPASMSDLTSSGALPFTPLKAQSAWTAEVGTRGQADFIAWDMSVYRSWVNNELLTFGLPEASGFVSFTDNADNTIHQGLELGVDILIARAALAEQGLALTWRNTYTWNDFQFDDDPTYGNNTLAGAPQHVYITELKLDADAGWYLSANLRWIPDGAYVDFANTTQAPGYTLVGLTAGVTVTDGVKLFGSVENLFDKTYISNVTTSANQAIEGSNAYTPGQGQAFFAGLSVAF